MTLCAFCDNPIQVAEKPRPGPMPRYCSLTCRRAAEFAIRRTQSLLLRAEKLRQDATISPTAFIVSPLPAINAEIAMLEARLLILVGKDTSDAVPDAK